MQYSLLSQLPSLIASAKSLFPHQVKYSKVPGIRIMAIFGRPLFCITQTPNSALLLKKMDRYFWESVVFLVCLLVPPNIKRPSPLYIESYETFEESEKKN